MTVSRIISGPTYETAIAADKDARIGNIFISARNGDAQNGPNSPKLL
jgi:hypothetical protein